MKKITLYCDGSSLGNPGFGGWCAILKYKETSKVISGAEANTTNNRMELKAVIEGIKLLKSPCIVELVSDSRYVCDGINEWLKGWQKRNFAKVKNPDLWQEYVSVATPHEIMAVWVKGHNGHLENEQCDMIARDEALRLKMGGKIYVDSSTKMPKKTDSTSKKNEKLADLSQDSNVYFKLESFEKIIKYHFKNKDLLIEALTHKSYNKTKNNERLEFLGDAVLDLLVGEYLFCKLESSAEGVLTKTRAAIVNEAGFAKLAKTIKLGDFLFISQSEENNNGRQKASILSNAFEAVVGAIYLDGGIESARKLSYDLIRREYKSVDLQDIYSDYKTLLQELTQNIFGVIPEYELVGAKGPDHNKEFTMAIMLNGEEYARAKGKSKKEAEQNCAKKTYDKLKKRG